MPDACPEIPSDGRQMSATIKICPLARPYRLMCGEASDGEFVLAGA